MSREAIVAKRYAKALFEAANQKGIAERVETQLKEIASTIAAHADLEQVLVHPNIDAAKKHETIDAIFGASVDALVLNAIKLLVDRKRESTIQAFVDAYVQISQDALGLATAKVSTAYALKDADAQAIATKLQAATGKKIRVEATVDANLIGGIQIQINGKLFDGSIAGQLERLKESMRQS